MTTRPARQRPGSATLIAKPESLVPIPAEPAPAATPKRPTAAEAPRVKRSIQLAGKIADTYDENVYALHAKHRVPKNRIHDAMLTIALKHLDEVEEEITTS